MVYIIITNLRKCYATEINRVAANGVNKVLRIAVSFEIRKSINQKVRDFPLRI